MASELHDSWIELPEAQEFSTARTLRLGGRLEFGEVHRLRSWGPFVRVEEMKPKIELIIEAVTAVALEDSAEIGGLNLASLGFDESSGTVTIEGHIPATVTLTVTSLAVRAVVTDEIAKRRERWRLRSSVQLSTPEGTP
jgi:hypothetical protein